MTLAIKTLVRTLAARRGISESALVRGLLARLLQNETVPDASLGRTEAHPNRSARLCVRLEPGDRALLKARASARGMRSATYLSVMARSHLRGKVPLPRAEYLALKETVHVLASLGRDLHQIARSLAAGAPATAPGLAEVRVMRKIDVALRDHVKGLLEANAKSWRPESEADNSH